MERNPTATRSELNAAMEAKLKETGVPFETIRVFGAIRVNVHVTCLSATAANKWVSLLTRVFNKAPTITTTCWPAAKNKGTCLRPTMRAGYLVTLIS